MKHKITAFALLIIVLCGCNNKTISSDKSKMKEINEITYRFGDSSVPPQYHRSYSIVLSSEKVSIVIDSYGDIIAEKEYDASKDTFNDILDLFTECKLTKGEEEKNNGCTGGTSETVWYMQNDEKAFLGSVYHCGGKDFGNLKGDIAKFATAMKALIPDFDELKKK